MSNTTPELVSVLIPSYNERFFGDALASALQQTYGNLEIIVSDDSPGRAIEEHVMRSNDSRVRYVRNRSRLGFARNFTQCFQLARGDFIKFLHDDARLLPECIERLAGVLAMQPAVTLATSRRRVIDARGTPQPDTFATTPVSLVPAIFLGWEFGNFALVNSANFIGEPTTVLFRRATITLEGDALFRWGDHDYHCLADLSLWLRLLAKGLAYYASAPLSEYRIHAGQEQRQPEVAVSCLRERLWIARQAREIGFLAAPSQYCAALAAIEKRAAGWAAGHGVNDPDRSAVEGLIQDLAAEASRVQGRKVS